MSQFAINKNGITNDVGAELFAAFVKGLLPTNGIINAFDNLACARVNDNLVRLSPGLYNMSGFITGVKPGTTADLAVDSGTTGYNRIDLVIVEFVRNGGGAGIDTSQIRILKGTSTTGSPVDPTLTQQDINGTGVTRQEALYRLTITGTTLAAPVLLATVLDNLASVVAMIALKAPLASPALTGTPTVPTAAVGTNTTQAASTAFVVAEIPNRVPQASETVAGKIEIATSAEAAAGTDTARAITPSGLRGGLNASGSAPIYACRAWLNFNGTGTPAFRGSRNISSITDNGTGDYTIVFTTPMPDENYVFVGCGVGEANTEVVMQKSGVHSAMQCGLMVLRPGVAFGDASMIQCAFFA